jgi:chromosomal replication initiator protein
VKPELDYAWQRIDAEVRRAVTDSTYAIWLEPLRPVELTGATLILSAPDELRTWIADRYGPLLQRIARHVLDGPIHVDIVAPQRAPEAPPARTLRAVAPDRAPEPATPVDQPLNPKLTFDQFVIGDSNRLAHAAALAVAEMPAQAYNPLYICGPPGLGKTHLLHAIGDYVVRYGSGLTVRYATVEAFTNEFVAALHGGSIDAFKARFRHIDVLLIDDVQFLETKAKTEEEFFHTFNALYDTGSQLVLTSDRPPRDLRALEDRLRERFESGLVCEVLPPDKSTRLTILRKRAAHDGIVPEDEDALDVIAERISDNVRALEGALIRVVAFASLSGRPVTGALAAEVLDGLYGRRRPVRRTVEDVQAAACDAFDITRDELLSASRSQRLVWPRQVAMYLARELTDQTLPAIGRAFGNRDHTTVMHACRRTAERIAGDPKAYEAVRALTERLHAGR